MSLGEIIASRLTIEMAAGENIMPTEKNPRLPHNFLAGIRTCLHEIFLQLHDGKE